MLVTRSRRSLTHLGLAAAILCAAGVAPLAAAPASDAVEPATATDASGARREFIAAMERVRLRLPDQNDSPALRGYVIYDYLLAARLRRDLQLKPGEDLDSAIDAFLQARAGQPVTRNLRNDWLASLASRRRWDWFLPRSADVTSPPLACDRLAARLASLQDTGSQSPALAQGSQPKSGAGAPADNTRSLAADALQRWSLPQQAPSECDSVFAWLRLQGALTPEVVESRTKAVLVADNPRLARELATDLPAERAAPILQWARLLEAPKPALAAIAANPSSSIEPDALTAGFDKLARSDSRTALTLLPQLLARPAMTEQTRARLQKSAALGAAYGHDSGALAAFDQLPATAIDNDVREWRVRAALWAGDFARVRNWIEEMPEALSGEPRWRYWLARAVAATQGNESAAPLYAQIAGLRDFYGYLAADVLRRGYMLNARASAADPPIQKVLQERPGLIRAHALFDCDLNDDANVEWAVELGGAAPPVRLQAALLAARWGWYSQSIATLAQLGELDDVRLRYPRPYPAEVAAASKLTQLPPDWILAVMRQESLFRDDAVSRAGARGLMQMEPTTAAAVAKRWHLPPPERDAPFDASQDVARGAARLRELLDKYGQLGLSLAAYNAGAVPVARWRPTGPMDADIWIENIPYGETRNYVQRIMEHIVAFAWVRNANPPRLTTLLPPVTPTTPALAGQSSP